jgi:cytochrome P450
VAVLIGSANRDPSVFDRPDDLDLSRDATGRLTLGDHDDLVTEAITKLRRRFPDLALAAEPTRLDDVIVNGYAAAPVTPGPRSAAPA